MKKRNCILFILLTVVFISYVINSLAKDTICDNNVNNCYYQSSYCYSPEHFDKSVRTVCFFFYCGLIFCIKAMKTFFTKSAIFRVVIIGALS